MRPTHSALLTVVLAAAAAVNAAAVDARDIPLAVTTLAHPSLSQTPTQAEIAKSDEYLEAGLVFLDKAQPRRAVAELEDSVRLAPRAENYKALGTAWYQAGSNERAAWAYRQSLQLAPDPKVQALVDSLEGKEKVHGAFKDENDRLRFERLVKEAAAYEKKGLRDTAMDSYHEALELQDEPKARRAWARLGVGLAEDYLAAQSLDKANAMAQAVDGYYKGHATDLSKDEMALLRRLETVKRQLTLKAGERHRETEKAFETDSDRRTERKKVDIHVDGE